MFKKLKNINVNYTLLVFLIYVGKTVAYSPTLADSIIVGVLAGAYGYTQYLKRFQLVRLDDEVAKDLLEVKQALGKLKLANTQEKLKNQKYF